MNSDLVKSMTRSRREGPPGWFKLLFFVVGVAIVLYAVCALNSGCTVSPAIVPAAGASYDGNAKDSGFKGWAPDGRAILSPGAAARYDELARAYGERFSPTVRPGLEARPDGTYLIDKEHLARLGEMSALRRMGEPP